MIKRNLSLTLLLLNLFIAFLGIGLVIPVLPSIMNELNLSGKVVGYLVAAFALAQLIFSPYTGRWVDKVGRKPMIVYGLIIFTFSELLFGLGKNVEVLFISRILGGISAAFIMPAVTAFIADITTMENRSKAMGYMSAAISTGFIIGPGIGGFLAMIGTRVPFFVAALLGLTAAIISFLALKEPSRQVDAIIQEKTNGMKKVFHPLFFIPFLVILISTFGLAAFESLFALYVDHKHQFTPKDIAIIITGAGIVGAITQVFFFDFFTRKWGEIRLIRYSFFFSAILVFAMTLVNSYLAIFLVTIFIFTGFDLIRPAITTYLSKIAENQQGFVSGMNSMFTSIGNVFGPMVGGYLFDVKLDYPYFFTTVMMIVGIMITYPWKQPKSAEAIVVVEESDVIPKQIKPN